MDIKIDELIVTQQSLRSPNQLADMYNYLQVNPCFDKKIIINKCEDNRLYLSDGHHRTSVIYLSGRKTLSFDEVLITNYTYKQYLDIEFIDINDNWLGWVTPIDIKSHVRLGDIGKFKKHIKDIYYNQSPMHANHYIRTNPALYLEKRTFFHIRDLALKYAQSVWPTKNFATAVV